MLPGCAVTAGSGVFKTTVSEATLSCGVAEGFALERRALVETSGDSTGGAGGVAQAVKKSIPSRKRGNWFNFGERFRIRGHQRLVWKNKGPGNAPRSPATLSLKLVHFGAMKVALSVRGY